MIGHYGIHCVLIPSLTPSNHQNMPKYNQIMQMRMTCESFFRSQCSIIDVYKILHVHMPFVSQKGIFTPLFRDTVVLKRHSGSREVKVFLCCGNTSCC